MLSLNLLDPLLEAMERPQTQPMRKVKAHGRACAQPAPGLAGRGLRGGAVSAGGLRSAAQRQAAGAGPGRAGAAQGGRLRSSRAAERASKRAGRSRSRGGTRRSSAGALPLAGRGPSWPTSARAASGLDLWQRRMWARYSRNLAVAAGQLLPNLFDMAAAARGVADDESLPGSSGPRRPIYPHQETETDLATAKVSGEQMWDGTRKMRLRSAHPFEEGQAEAGWPTGAQRRAREGRVEERIQGPGHLLVPAGRLAHRGLRHVPQEQGQGVALGRALADRALHDLAARRHRPARDAAQLARRAAHLRAREPATAG